MDIEIPKHLTDEELRDRALAEFEEKAAKKFNAGTKEHNPNGDKGLDRMSKSQKLAAVKEEVMDLWFYVTALEVELLREISDEAEK